MPRLIRTLEPANETAASTGGANPGDLTAWPESVGTPLGVILIFAVLTMILALAYLLRRSVGGIDSLRDEGARRADRHQATQAVDRAIAELELGGDVRTAILACFQRFSRLLGARGITEQAALTPRELERLAVERLRVSARASGTLTALFEEARYSEHLLGEADRVRAIDSLAGIRAALEA